MSAAANVIAFRPTAAPLPPDAARIRTMVEGVAAHRRAETDVYWLKEAAELLNVLDAAGQGVDAGSLSAFESYYATARSRMAFFPQYYRFHLSICLDLESLGMPGDTGAALAEEVARQDMVGGETSDLQRLEVRRQLDRRGIDTRPADPGLEDRIRAFIGRPRAFAVPNRKAAYELTHAVFYLSDFGRRDPRLDAEALDSLEFAGLLALLDENTDLLAEICLALGYAGRTAPAAWHAAVARDLASYVTGPSAAMCPSDDYHAYLMGNWLHMAGGGAPFTVVQDADNIGFVSRRGRSGALRALSRTLLTAEPSKRGDWQVMQSEVENSLENPALFVLTEVQRSTQRFDDFFEYFARAEMELH